MRARRLSVGAFLLLLLALHPAAPAQEEQPEAETTDNRIVAHERGRALLEGGRETPLSVAISPRGALFELDPLVRLLGGTLRAGPAGQSYVLLLGGQEAVLGAGSPVLVIGQQIVSLTQPPLGSTGGVQVPLDALERTFGEAYGYHFDWLANERLLRVSRDSSEVVAVDFDWVHSQGITTLLLKFPQRPRFEWTREGNNLRVRGLGTALAAPSLPDRIDDPLLRGIAAEGGSLLVLLHPSAAAAEPYELQRDDRFELVFDLSRAQTVAPVSAAGAAVRRPLGGGAKIAVDPGHGGSEHGAIGKGGSKEKELTLLLARSFKTRLERRLPVQVVLTRDEDVDLPIDVRTAIANQHQADLFVSIHLNAEPWGAGAHGTETYFLSKEASDGLAADAAAFENRAAGDGPDNGDSPFALQLVLWDLAQNRHLAESQRLANMIQEELNTTLDLKDRGVKQAPFRVLLGATMPAVLVELGFLSNPEEERRLGDAEYRQRLVDALVEAVVRFRGGPSSGAAAEP